MRFLTFSGRLGSLDGLVATMAELEQPVEVELKSRVGVELFGVGLLAEHFLNVALSYKRLDSINALLVRHRLVQI